MPINPLIAMSGRVPEITSYADERAKAQQTADINALNQQKIAQAGQATQEGAQKLQFSQILANPVIPQNNALINAAQPVTQQAPAWNNPDAQAQEAPIDRAVQIQDNFAKMPEKEQTRLKSVLDAGEAITPLVKTDDQQGVIKALQERKKELGSRMAKGEDIHTEDTDAGIQQAKTDWAGFKQTHAGLIEVGQMLGYYKSAKDLDKNANRPALLQTLDAYKSASPEDKAILRTFAKVDEKGNTIDPATGNIINAPGSLTAAEAAAKAKEAGKQQAQLQYEPTIEGNKAKAKSDSEFKAKAQQNLPQVLDNADYLNTLLDGLLNAPGKAQAVGLSSLVPIIPGTPAADFKARLEQVNGEQFLQAFQSLKGGGQITEIEGKKATDAIARMQTSQTEAEFDKSVKEFKDIVDKATKRAKAAAGSNVAGESPPAYGNNTSGQTPAEKAASSLPEEIIPTGGNINALPQGAKQIGTSGGKPVFQTPDGKKFVQD